MRDNEGSESCFISIASSVLLHSRLIVMSLNSLENWIERFVIENCFSNRKKIFRISWMMKLKNWLKVFLACFTLEKALMLHTETCERKKLLNKLWANFLLQSLYIKILIMLLHRYGNKIAPQWRRRRGVHERICVDAFAA